MKFCLKEAAKGGIRLGTITGLPRLPDLILETPLLILHTRGGSVPHITKEVLELLTKEKHAFQISLPTTLLSVDTLKSYKKGISSFIGLPEHVVYCSVQDPGSLTPTGYNAKTSVSVWTHKGRTSVEVDKYMEVIEAFRPDIYQALCDGDTDPDSCHKRCAKTVENTHRFLDVCIEKHNKSDALKSSALLGVIDGGCDLKERIGSAKLISSKSEISGFVINGLHHNGPEVTNIQFNRIKPIVEETLRVLPDDKPRFMHGSWRPEHLLKLIELGVDVFDSSLAYTITQQFLALNFKYESVPCDFKEDSNNEDKPYTISLKDEIYFADFSPIDKDCSCLTCTKHTKAYIHHLINSKELLAPTLLMLHNLHQCIEFFKFIRKAASENKKVRII